jgi:NhaP-type Na+/H+ or K+/H+ antiporter
VLATGVPHDFVVDAAVLGALLVGGALLSGLARRSFLSLTALFVLLGFILGQGGLEVLNFSARSGFVGELAVVALIVILFRDGLEAEAELIQKEWHLPARKLVVAMPLTAAIVAVAAHVLTDLDWTQAALLGALLAPTDPVLSSSVVTNPRVPRVIRHSLNLESGLNDGLALPFVLLFLAAVGHDDFDAATFFLRDVGLGVVGGLAFGFAGSYLLPRGDREQGIPDHQRALYALGIAFATYGVTTLVHGNGFIAVFVCAMTLGVRRADVVHAFERGSGELVEVVKLGIFVVFGSLLTVDGLFGDGWAAVAIVVVAFFVARPVALWVALAGTRTSRAAKAFMAWFGPKGVATMTFSLFVLEENVPGGTQIFNLAALAVFASILVHGLTDAPGVDWIAEREPPDEPDGDGGAPAAAEAQAPA